MYVFEVKIFGWKNKAKIKLKDEELGAKYLKTYMTWSIFYGL